MRLLSGAGPALHLDTTKGEVLVTVRRAREAAGVINDLSTATRPTLIT